MLVLIDLWVKVVSVHTVCTTHWPKWSEFLINFGDLSYIIWSSNKHNRDLLSIDKVVNLNKQNTSKMCSRTHL